MIVIGATNRPDIIDPALLRPGRFDKLLLTPPPTEKGRLEIFRIHTKAMPLTKDINLNELAKQTEGYVGADIDGVCREAAMMALREDIKSKDVRMEHFVQALEIVKPSVDKEIEEAYEKLKEYFSTARAKEIKEEKSGYFG